MNNRFEFNDYVVEVEKIFGELRIKAESISPEYLVKAYHKVKGKEETLQNAVKRAILIYHSHMARRIAQNKREIRQELKQQGVKVKPGSPLSKKLRQDYLPEVEPSESISGFEFF